MSLGVALDSLFLILFRSSGKFRSSIALSFAFRRRLQAVRHFFGFFVFLFGVCYSFFFWSVGVCFSCLVCVCYSFWTFLVFGPTGWVLFPCWIQSNDTWPKTNPIQRPKQQKGGCDSVFYDDELTTTSRWLKCHWIVGLSLHSSQYREIHNEIFCWRL